MWYINSRKCLQTHVGHEYDTNLVLLFSDGNYYDSVSDNYTGRLLDIILHGESKKYAMPTLNLK